jgi:poly-gamma-glutamate capsule biosynthesis protein CapA/YwtB (metallophosphatase superfamily)
MRLSLRVLGVLLLCIAAVAAGSCLGGAAGVVASSRNPEAPKQAVRLLAQVARLPRLTLAAAGDCTFDRGVRAVCAERGREWPLSAVRDIMAAADVAFLNLETSIARGGARLPGKGIWFRSAPEFAQELADAGIDVVTLANNHVLDYDDPAFDETLSNLSAAGIDVCGGGKNMAEARRPAVLSANGISVAFLGYSEFADIYWSVARPKRFVAGEAGPGISPWDREAIVEDIRRAKRLADHVVVSFHWGDEYVSMPADRQVQLAHAAIDAGASVVHGHHPHVLQPVEVYHGGVIFYSLGNFVFDQKKPATVESMIAHVTFSPEAVVRAEIIPVRIEECRPRPLKAWAARAALDKISLASARMGARIVTIGERGLVMGPIKGGPIEAEGFRNLLP